MMRGIAETLFRTLIALSLLLVPSFAKTEPNHDPGVRLEVDLALHRLVVVDLASGESGPELALATGSPAYTTPSGEFRLHRVIHNPSWIPGETARSLGAEETPPSHDGPMGIAKIPFSGSYFLHGGGSPYAVGKSLSLGCLRATDASMQELLDWLHEQHVLGARKTRARGEASQPFIRPVKLIIR